MLCEDAISSLASLFLGINSFIFLCFLILTPRSVKSVHKLYAADPKRILILIAVSFSDIAYQHNDQIARSPSRRACGVLACGRCIRV
jgi:hypothetical protein